MKKKKQKQKQTWDQEGVLNRKSQGVIRLAKHSLHLSFSI